MFRKLLRVSGAAVLATLAALTIPSSASADDLTALAASVTPDEGRAGDTVTATVMVTNNHYRKITYAPLSTPDMFSDCAVEVGTILPGDTATITCDGVIPATEATLVFGVTNAPTEHNVTSAEAVVELTILPDETPPTPEQPSEEAPPQFSGPSLPTTGTPAGWIALGGASAVAVGLITLRLIRQRESR